MYRYTSPFVPFCFQVLKLQDSCKNYSQEVSTLAHTCDRLSDDLVSCRANCSEWEREVLSKEEEVSRLPYR